MRTITISKGTQDALVDDEDYDRLSEHKWFSDRSQIYTKLSFNTDKRVGPKTFTLKVRMDYFIYNYTSHINARIIHVDRNPYNCQRDNLIVDIKDVGSPQYRRTIYLGVVLTPTRVKTTSGETDKFLRLLHREKYTGDESTIIDGGDFAIKLARDYDNNIRGVKGNQARANFLLPPLPHRETNDA